MVKIMPTRKLRIAMFLNELYPKSIIKRSPIIQQVVLLSKELINRGHNVELFSYAYDFTIDGSNAKGITPKVTKVLGPHFVRKYIRNFDILHVHFLMHGRAYTRYIPLIKPLIRKKLVGTAYGSDIRRDSGLLSHRLYLKFIFKLMDHLIVMDPDLKDIAEKVSMKSERISIIPSALKTNRFLPERPTPKDIAKLVENRTVVLFNARLHPFKDPLTLIKAIPLVLNQRKDIIFLIAGDGELKSAIENFCKKFKIGSHVCLLGWRFDIPNLLSAADIFLQISPIENIWATSLMEAMLMGKGIIATDVGFTANYLKNREDALLIGPKNPKKLAEAIIELSENEELRKNMGKNCMNYAVNEFVSDKLVDKIEKIYYNL